MKTTFTEQESLAVISEMIDRARNNVQKGSAYVMISNGYAVAIVALMNFILMHTLPADIFYYAYCVWFLMIPVGFVNYFIRRHVDHSAIVKTQIDSIISYLWRGFAVSIIILTVILLTLSIVRDDWWFCFLFTPVIMLMIAIAEFGMAKATRFKPFFWGAIYFWTGAFLSLLSFVVLKRGDLHFLILSVCMIAGFILPGHILNNKEKENV